MKIVNAAFMNDLTEKRLNEYKSMYTMYYIDGFQKYKRYSRLIYFVIVVGTALISYIGSFMTFEDTPMMTDSFIPDPIAFLILLLICFAIIMVVHEFIHYSFYPSGRDKKYIIPMLPGYIFTFYDDFMSKKRSQTVLIAPFAIINLFILFLFFLGVNRDIIFLLLLINISSSSSDIFVFIYQLINAPAKSHVYSNHFTTDNVK